MPSERTAPRAAPGASLWERAATVAHRLPRELHDPLAPNTSRAAHGQLHGAGAVRGGGERGGCTAP